MRYEVITNKEGYVEIIKRNVNDAKNIYELDLSKYDLTGLRLYAHKLVEKKLIFDEKKYQELLNEREISKDKIKVTELKAKLTETDYLVSRCFEEVMELSNPITWMADVLKITLKFTAKYKKVIEDRKQWRKEIEELEDKINGNTNIT